MTSELLDCIVSRDPTWHFAYHYVRKHFDVPSHLCRLIRTGWMGDTTPMDFVKVIGFSKLNPGCLIQAAELSGSDSLKGRGAVERAITFLGSRFSSVVLGVQLYTYIFLSKKPPLGWKSFLQDMMDDIELGYRFGSHASLIGTEGGALCGFACASPGLGLLMAVDSERYKEYLSLRRTKSDIQRKDEIEIFGCELYQLSTLILQQLGFGAEFAVGIALSSGYVNDVEMGVSERSHHWEAAMQWILALKHQRNYPREENHREMFSEIKPPPLGGERNKRLEILHTEVGRLKSHPSEWVWHLPKSDYEQTRSIMKLS